MDINDARAIVTALSFFAFVGIVWWAYSSRRRKTYDAAARMPIEDDDKPVHASTAPHAREPGSLPPTGGNLGP